MSGLVIGGIATIAAGVLITTLGLVLWVRARRRSARAEGVVIGLEDRGSGEFPVVQFTTGQSAAPIRRSSPPASRRRPAPEEDGQDVRAAPPLTGT